LRIVTREIWYSKTKEKFVFHKAFVVAKADPARPPQTWFLMEKKPGTKRVFPKKKRGKQTVRLRIINEGDDLSWKGLGSNIRSWGEVKKKKKKKEKRSKQNLIMNDLYLRTDSSIKGPHRGRLYNPTTT